ncbi:MAG: hypothetical protein ACOYXT_18510 [Bacteroidota bacterium]
MAENKQWTLQSFVDTLVFELDKARQTLSFKGVNHPLTYAVKDLSVELQVFPDYDGDEIKFTTARAGQDGSSKIAFQLGSITDRQIRETSKPPLDEEDVPIESLELDDEVKKDLKKIGIDSVKDIQRIENQNINLKPVVKNKVNFSDLAGKIEKAKRAKNPPSVGKAALSLSMGEKVISIDGDNLHLSENFTPAVFLNQKPLEVVSFSKNNILVKVHEEDVPRNSVHQLTMFLDPYAVVNLKLKS